MRNPSWIAPLSGDHLVIVPDRVIVDVRAAKANVEVARDLVGANWQIGGNAPIFAFRFAHQLLDPGN